MEQIIQMAMKYPVLFYSLVKFRYHFKRLVYGDKFWHERKNLKSRFEITFTRKPKDLQTPFATEKLAIKETARALIADIIAAHSPHLELSTTAHPLPKVLKGLQRAMPLKFCLTLLVYYQRSTF